MSDSSIVPWNGKNSRGFQPSAKRTKDATLQRRRLEQEIGRMAGSALSVLSPSSPSQLALGTGFSSLEGVEIQSITHTGAREAEGKGNL